MAKRLFARLAVLVVAALLAGPVGCIDPKSSRPGLRLSGELAGFPSDWGFSDDHREVAIEVRPPYGIPHSVTIWCASLEGRLYVAAREPETKRWPGWVDRDPDVRIRVGDRIYEARLAAADAPEQVRRIRAAYVAKYDMRRAASEDPRPMRYWLVEPRAGG